MANLTSRKYFEPAFLALILLGIVAGPHPFMQRGQSLAATTSSSMANDKRYSTDLKELRAKFNQDKGKVRLLLLLSPTCPYCLRGASEIETTVLEQVKSSDVRVYAVYVPILRGDTETTVPAAMEKLPDSRVVFFWDPKAELSESYAAVLQLPKGRPAWDVYLAFDRAAEWKSESPTPIYWMHQLGGVSPDRWLDGQKFAVKTNKLLGEKPE